METTLQEPSRSPVHSTLPQVEAVESGGAATAPAQGYKVTVVVPARNEEATIAQVVERSYAAFDQIGQSGEVLVVDDGSRDGTGAVLAGLRERFPSLRIFTHRRSQGMTAALQRMFDESRGDVVILIPADMESDPLLDVPALVRGIEEHDLDVVAGWRQGRKDGKVLASGVYNLVMQ
ncbi:MAG: glycosyltransferase, partial [Caldilineaceae bacterium]